MCNKKLEMRSVDNLTVSVIIPNYNHAKYLRQRLDSVLDQTFTDFEIIILDDCSTDDSIQIIEAYKAYPKISHIVINNQNSGSPFLQWQRGIELARGEWIWIAESDDWCEPTFLKTLLSGIDDGVAISYCQSIVVDENSNILWETGNNKLSDRIQGSVFFENHLKGNKIINASMAIFQKEVYNKTNKLYLKWKNIGDWIFWLEFALKGDVLISGKKLNYFRKHPGDVRSKAIVSGAWHFEKLDVIQSLFEKGIINEKKRKERVINDYLLFLDAKSAINELDRNKLCSIYRAFIGFRIYYHYISYQINKTIRKIFKWIRKAIQ
jgi:glycosyltransferase involved in cell wall biosynthesis